MKYNKMHKNMIFREITCGLSIEQTAKLCFKTVRQVKLWDKGKDIPPEQKRLMKFATRKELSNLEEWQGFKITGSRLELPTGHAVTPQQILTGIALIEIGSELELKTTAKLLKFVRAIEKIKSKRRD